MKIQNLLIAASSILMALNSFAMSNPASAYCVEKGGDLQVVSTSTGSFGLCYLGGAIIEEWTLFRGSEGVHDQVALVAYRSDNKAFDVHGNPASLNCIRQGGEGVFVKDKDGGEIGLCKFSDGSMIEEWTLFEGPASPRNADLNRILDTGM